ncbi:MAG: NCS2 family permease [Propionibacteriaceae bacterium]
MVLKSPKAVRIPAESAATSAGGLDGFFSITERGSTIRREIVGGLVTFFTMAYILALNPIIIGTQTDVNGMLISGLPKLDGAGHVIGANVNTSMAMVATATALIAGLMTILMGVYARFPIALATGLGLNALLAYVIVPTMTWQQAMGLVLLEGIIITALVLTGVRTAIFKAVPRSMRAAISVGIGLFVAFVGLIDGGLVRKPAGAPPVELGINGSIQGWPLFIFIFGLLLCAVLHAKKVPGGLLIAILGSTALAAIIEAISHQGVLGKDNPGGWMLNVPALSDGFHAPNLGLIGQVDLFGAFFPGGSFSWSRALSLLLIVFALLLSDFFDTMGTVVAVGAEAGLLDKHGNPPRLKEILLVDSIAAMAGGIGSVSSNTSYIESASGVGAGARTGLSSVVAGVAFVVSMFLSPLVLMVPSEASTPVLVFVGFLMMSQVTEIDWHDIEEGLPAFLTIVLMPFSFSITAGIGAGFIFHVVLKTVRGKMKQVHPLMWVVAAAFLVYFIQGLLMSLIK